MPVSSSSSSPSSGPPRPDGLVLAPFRALRYDPDRADLASVTSPPYDVIDAAGVEALEQASDVNVVRLILPRDERSDGDRYAGAASRLVDWRSSGVLRPDPDPALYVYEQSSDTHTQRGLVGALALTPAEDGIVLPHENTMSDTVSDRLALYTAVGADLEPIFLVYAGGGAASKAVAAVDDREPLVDAVLADGLRHRLWAITDPDELAAIAADLHPRTALIADGHHRYATYLQRQSNDPANRAVQHGLTFLVDSTRFGPEVHPIHRVVVGVPAGELSDRTASAARVTSLDGTDLEKALTALAKAGPGSFLLVSGDAATVRLVTDLDAERSAAAMPAERSAAWRALDVSLLHHYLVPEVWGLVDNTSTVRYEHSAQEAVELAAETGGTAVLLNATSPEAVARVAADGERMPRKSTLFTPKPRTGIVIRDHRDA